jgi:hypothetical protein
MDKEKKVQIKIDNYLNKILNVIRESDEKSLNDNDSYIFNFVFPKYLSEYVKEKEKCKKEHYLIGSVFEQKLTKFILEKKVVNVLKIIDKVCKSPENYYKLPNDSGLQIQDVNSVFVQRSVSDIDVSNGKIQLISKEVPCADYYFVLNTNSESYKLKREFNGASYTYFLFFRESDYLFCHFDSYSTEEIQSHFSFRHVLQINDVLSSLEAIENELESI